MTNATSDFEQQFTFEGESPTLIEGFPGLGLVASIAIDQITKQLDLDYYGQIRCASLPPVASYSDGHIQDLVRVYAGTAPPVLTLQSDLAIPPNAIDSVSTCVLSDIADEINRAIFLAGAPARNEDERGDVVGVATNSQIEKDLRAANIDIAEGAGLIGGITGSLVNDCYLNDIPAAVLIVNAHPSLPDPAAAQSVIETALEPLVDFDIDTTELKEQADNIQRQLQQIAEQYQKTAQEQETQAVPASPSMYQ